MSRTFNHISKNEGKFLYVNTNSPTSNPDFDPDIVSSGNVASWNYGDGTTQVSNGPIKTYGSTALKRVQMVVGEYSDITMVTFTNCDIIGEVDLSKFSACDFIVIRNEELMTSLLVANGLLYDSIYADGSGLSTLDLSGTLGIKDLLLQASPSLTSLTLPTTSNLMTRVDCSSCDLTGALNVPFSGLAGIVELNGNPNLTSVTFAASTNILTRFDLNTCDITGALDVSMLVFTGCFWNISGNANLTSISFPSVLTNCSINIRTCSSLTGVSFPPTTATNIYMDSCDLTGTLDLTNVSTFSDLLISTNPNLTAVTLTAHNDPCGRVAINNSNLTGAFDLSGITNITAATSSLAAGIRLESNPLLTSVSLPTMSNAITLRITSCNLTGTLDLSMLTGIFYFNGSSNPLLTALTLPTSTTPIELFFASSCALGYVDFTSITNMTDINGCNISLQVNNQTATEVTDELMDLDELSSGGFTGRLINLAGTNAAINDSVDRILSLNAPGTGYLASDVLTITGGGGTGGQITVNTVGGSGEILTYTLSAGGSGYISQPTSYTGGAGASAEFTVNGGEIAKTSLTAKTFTVTTN